MVPTVSKHCTALLDMRLDYGYFLVSVTIIVKTTESIYVQVFALGT